MRNEYVLTGLAIVFPLTAFKRTLKVAMTISQHNIFRNSMHVVKNQSHYKVHIKHASSITFGAIVLLGVTTTHEAIDNQEMCA